MELISRVGAVVDDCLYCSLRYANGLFKTNLKTGENKFLSFFDNQSILQSGLHRDCKKVGDLLCFAPESNGIMNIYNYRTNTMKSVNCSGAASLFCCDDLLWYIPCHGGDFLAFQEDSFECKKYRPVGYDNIDTFCQCGDGILYGFVDSHYIWLLIDNTSKICCYDTRTNKIKLFDTGVQSLITISKGNDGIWLVPKYGARIILWNPKDGTKKTFECDGMSEKNHDMCFRFVVDNGIDVYVFPSFANLSILRLEAGKMVECVPYPKDIIFYNRHRTRFLNYTFDGKKYYINPANCNYLVKIYGSHVEYIKIEQFRNDEVESIYARKMFSDEKILYESEVTNLDRFIFGIKDVVGK